MKWAAPYSTLARNYDRTIGLPSFDLTRRNFEAIARLLNLRFGAAADLGCGTGLFARYLARRFGANVFAVDRSPEMAALARRQCAGLPVTVLQQDIRRLALPGPVHLITANFDTLNHLLTIRDLAAAVRCIARALLPGGHFFGDFLTPAVPIPPGCGVAIRFPGMTQVLRRSPRRPILACRVISPPDRVERHYERLYSPALMRRLFERAGLIILGLRSATTLGPLGPATHRGLLIGLRG